MVRASQQARSLLLWGEVAQSRVNGLKSHLWQQRSNPLGAPPKGMKVEGCRGCMGFPASPVECHTPLSCLLGLALGTRECRMQQDLADEAGIHPDGSLGHLLYCSEANQEPGHNGY